MLAQVHMERFGTTPEQLAAVAVKNHANGLLNPHAQYHLKVSVEDVLASTMVADPLHTNPLGGSHKYSSPIARVINAILLGVLTYDGNLIILEPRHTRKKKKAHAKPYSRR